MMRTYECHGYSLVITVEADPSWHQVGGTAASVGYVCGNCQRLAGRQRHGRIFTTAFWRGGRSPVCDRSRCLDGRLQRGAANRR
jgi:hypothetical protein